MDGQTTAKAARILVFGGTTEGRLLAEWVSTRGDMEACVCCATEYGGTLVGDLPRVEALSGRLDREGMERLMGSRDFCCAVDCTHPYAVDVSANARTAASTAGLEYLRVVREGEPEGDWHRAADPAEAALLVAGLPGNVLLTTGTKDLATFAALVPDARERLFARILPVEESREAARAAGLADGHVVTARGPFSQEENERLIRALGARVLVTKASGAAGGFWQKVAAARSCGCALVVVGRPSTEEGLTMEEACCHIDSIVAGRGRHL